MAMTIDELFQRHRPRVQAAFEAAFTTSDSLAHFIRVHMPPHELENMVGANSTLDVKIGAVLFGQADDTDYRRALFTAACSARPGVQALRDLAVEVEIAIGEVLGGLEAVAAQPATRSAAAPYRGEIARASGCAALVGDLKWLHDQVDQVRRIVYSPLQMVARRMPAQDALVDLARHLGFLRSLRGKMLEKLRDGTFSGDDFPWIEEGLADAEAAAGRALSDHIAEPLTEAIDLIRNVVEVELADINGRLTLAAKTLDLPTLVARMEDLRRSVAPMLGQNADLANLDRDLAALNESATRLTSLLTEHTKWQRIDNLVYNLDNMLSSPVSAAVSSWKPLKRRLDALHDGPLFPVPVGLAEAGAQMDRAIAAADQNGLLVAFPAFATILRDHFTGLDKSLLIECSHVRGVGGGLSRVAAALGG